MNLQGDNKGNIELIVFKKMQSRRTNKSIKFKKGKKKRYWWGGGGKEVAREGEILKGTKHNIMEFICY